MRIDSVPMDDDCPWRLASSAWAELTVSTASIEQAHHADEPESHDRASTLADLEPSDTSR